MSVAKITAPKLIIGSQDRNADVLELMKSPDPKQSKIVAGPGVGGIVLLTGADGAAFKQTVRDFLLK